MTSVEGFLESIGVPLLHRIPTARRAFYGAVCGQLRCVRSTVAPLLNRCLAPQLGTAIGVNTIMPLLDRLLPASTLNLIVAFVRNGLCVIKDIWPLLLARRLPSIRGRVPLEVCVLECHAFISWKNSRSSDCCMCTPDTSRVVTVGRDAMLRIPCGLLGEQCMPSYSSRGVALTTLTNNLPIHHSVRSIRQTQENPPRNLAGFCGAAAAAVSQCLAGSSSRNF